MGLLKRGRQPRAGASSRTRESRQATTGCCRRNFLNRTLSQTAVPLYNAGHYDEACAVAFKQLEILVRQLADLPDGLAGRDLMVAAFQVNTAVLTDRDSEISEQVGVRDLMTGAMQYYRNPLSHRNVGVADPRQAASIILVANELMAQAMIHHWIRQERTSQETRPADP